MEETTNFDADTNPVVTSIRPRPEWGRFRFLREIVGTLFFGVAVFTLLQLAMPQSMVQGMSMQPTFYEGQRLLISRINFLFDSPDHGDIIVFNSPNPLTDNEAPLIKRVIGLPGDTIEIIETQVYRNGEMLNEEGYINAPCRTFKCPDDLWELGPDEYFVMGDNRNQSRDSRDFGPVSADLIIGEAIFRFWPLDTFGSVHQYHYD